MSMSLASLRNGKFFAAWIEKVNMVGSSARIEAVPLPWCTSQSRIATRRAQPSACIDNAAMAESLNTQSGSLNALAQKRVLRHRKSVSRRQRQHIVVGVEDLHGVKG